MSRSTDHAARLRRSRPRDGAVARGRAGPRARGASARGFTFIGLLFLIVLMGLMAMAAASTWTFLGQREKEEQLLFAGGEYRAAIGRFAAAHAQQAQPYPTTLEQLLGGDDRRAPVRYLRRLYVDPITGNADWGLVKSALGGITGVYSRSELRPIRTRAAPDAADLGIAFATAKTYRDWVFAGGAAAGSATGNGGAQGAIPGWNYLRDGEPPLNWESPPAAPVAEPIPPG